MCARKGPIEWFHMVSVTYTPFSALICNNAKDSGVRYFYDVVTLSCRQFVYYGCSGNANNFPDESECEAACRTSPLTTTVAYPMIAYELRCPAPFSNPTNWPKICKSEKDSSCDGTCISLSNGISVCCTTPSSPSRPSNSELCGTGFAPVIHGPEEGLSHCSTDEDCDGGICHFSAVIMAKICCTNGVSAYDWKCPPKYKNVNGVCIVGGSFNQRA
ncbi:Kunitz/Bovine pancreatic trypsin inhibitor domain protein [Trichostrongylus colubriformis]|uniref:Kunitz/Bovine pancreatic trypsin inhibitor domain protein n=1 Tax=Trichostrongylus colubriformis TaxID=6319 RepID=A0AAN8FE69_TRICO